MKSAVSFWGVFQIEKIRRILTPLLWAIFSFKERLVDKIKAHVGNVRHQRNRYILNTTTLLQ